MVTMSIDSYGPRLYAHLGNQVLDSRDKVAELLGQDDIKQTTDPHLVVKAVRDSLKRTSFRTHGTRQLRNHQVNYKTADAVLQVRNGVAHYKSEYFSDRRSYDENCKKIDDLIRGIDRAHAAYRRARQHDRQGMMGMGPLTGVASLTSPAVWRMLRLGFFALLIGLACLVGWLVGVVISYAGFSGAISYMVWLATGALVLDLMTGVFHWRHRISTIVRYLLRLTFWLMLGLAIGGAISQLPVPVPTIFINPAAILTWMIGTALILKPILSSRET